MAIGDRLQVRILFFLSHNLRTNSSPALPTSQQFCQGLHIAISIIKIVLFFDRLWALLFHGMWPL